MSHVRLLQIFLWQDKNAIFYFVSSMFCQRSCLTYRSSVGNNERWLCRKQWCKVTSLNPNDTTDSKDESEALDWDGNQAQPLWWLMIGAKLRRFLYHKRARSFLSLLPFILTELNDPYTSDLKSFAVSRRSCRSKNALLQGKYCQAWKSTVHFAHQRFECETDLLPTTLWLTGDCYSLP